MKFSSKMQLVLLILLPSYLNSFHLNSYLVKKQCHSAFKLKTSANEFYDELTLPDFIQQFNKFTVSTVKEALVLTYGDRDFARFYALETIARVPYFSYVSVLHLYETLGWTRRAEYIKVHFAESWNELHHLLIMEHLGGNDRFIDRFVAQHIAFFYYWIVVFLYIASPAIAYDLNKNVEEHAFMTYDKYLKSHEDYLKSLPAPEVALNYYQNDDLSLFDAFQNFKTIVPSRNSEVSSTTVRRPVISTLYDVFVNIRDDEAEHAKSMAELQRDASLRSKLRDMGYDSEANVSYLKAIAKEQIDSAE